MWVAGQLIAIGVLRGLLGRTDQWAWRIPYAIQWAWPVPIIIGVFLAPESPWWLVRKGRVEEAKKALRGLTSKTDTSYSVDDTVAMMVHTNEHEKYVSEGVTYWDCFTGVDLRRTEIISCVWMIQVCCGIWYGGNVVYFLEQAGFNPTKSFDFGVGENALGFCGTLVSWSVMRYVGRRTLYLCGLAIMFTILITVGFMGIPNDGPAVLGWISGGLLMLFVFTYDITVGPVCYCLVSEIPSTRLRIKSVVIARNCYNIASIVANFLNPPILNPTAWNLRGKGGFVWCGFCLLSFIWSYFRLPEPKGLSAGEIDVLFERGVSARNFSKINADPFRSTNLKVAVDGQETQHIEEKS
jgi:SP family general alpha glucoside:H+ symporter-like MFS transporter